MSEHKRVMPYQRLLQSFREFVDKCQFRHRKTMWHYPKARLHEGWKLSDLWERTAAAEQLDYDVQLLAKEDGLHVQYVKKIPDRPWNI